MKLRFLLPALFLLFSLGSPRAEVEMTRTLKNTSPNRAPDSVVWASSYRRARFSEIKGRSLMLLAPQIWSWWIPGYAADRDSGTFWAVKKSSGEWIELQVGNRLMPAVPVKRVVVNFGEDRPSRFAILGSKDGKDFKNLKAVFFEQSAPVVFNFDQPVVARYLKLEFYAAGSGKGISIREIQVFGPDEEQMPAPAIEVKAEPLSGSEAKLRWDYSRTAGPVYLFKIYRGTDANFVPDASHLIEETDATQFIDRSLKPGTTYYYKVGSEGFSGDLNLSSPVVSASSATGSAFFRMPMRGVIEGFYNQPFPHTERVRLIRFLAQNNFNYYIYAPKNDPYHRQLWRESYPEDEQKNFQELVQTANVADVTFNFGISPGLSINYNDPAEVGKLESKLKQMFELGIRAFTLCLDDIPGSKHADEKMARDQVKVVNELSHFLKALDPNCQLFFVPTVYSFPYSHWVSKNRNFAKYLAALAGIDRDVLIMWTGPSSTFSDTIDLKSAAEYQQLWSRPLLVWDNYPVNDGGLQNNIFLGPYTGRDLALGQAVGGIFSNPMFWPNADRVALFAVGKYFSAPDYDPWRAYQEAMPVVGKGAPDALKDLADGLLNNPKFPSMNAEVLPVKKAMDRYWAAYATGKYENESKELRSMLERYADNPGRISQLENQRLWLELEPASEKLSLYAKASLAAMDCLEGKGGKAGECRRDAKKYLKSAREIKTKVADNHQGFFWYHFGPEIDKPLFPQFVKKALKK